MSLYDLATGLSLTNNLLQHSGTLGTIEYSSFNSINCCLFGAKPLQSHYTTNVALSSIGAAGTEFNEILIKMQ